LGEAGQALPQTPQFWGSFVASTHRLPHSMKLGAHTKLQLPAAQLGAPLVTAGQALSHAPQCSTLVWVSTQAAPHWVVCALQPAAQAPALQT
jgi:hypothetical protein